MIKAQILDKKSICHCLLTSSNDPEILIPIKGVIEDVFFEEHIPIYSIRIIKFYDNINFLKSNFIEKSFLTNYRGAPKPIRVPKKIKTVEELDDWFGSVSKYRFCIESNLVTKTKNEMMELFNKVQNYLICLKIRSLKKIFTRIPYKGEFRLNSNEEFNKRWQRGFADLFHELKDFEDFMKNI